MTKLQDVNTRDIDDAIRLGCHTMQSVFNADDNDIPFFDSRVWPQAYLGFMCPYHEAHVPGRHLNALLEAESALGMPIDESAIEKHARAAFYSYSGPAPFPLNREQIGDKPTVFADHNLREGFHALYALVRYRGDRRARELARVLADKATSEFFTADGAFDAKRFGTHTHSATCTLSGLAQLADLLDDAALMERVRAFCDNGLRAICDGIGWVVEHLGLPDWNTDRGECNNTGDVLEARMILGRRGYPGCWHEVERTLRGHLLPAQLRDISFIADPPNPRGEDRLRDVANRHRGAFGFPAPYGHEPLGLGFVDFNMDIVGGAVASLCEAHRAAVESGPAGHRVNLLFDRQTAALRVESPYAGGALRITMKKPGPLWVRIPPWVNRDSLRFAGADQPLRYDGEYAFCATPQIGRPLTFAFDMPAQTTTLKHATRDIRVRWHGDEVAAMDNFGANLTYFDPFE